MSTVNLIVTTANERREVQIPVELVEQNQMDMLLSNLRESDVPVPSRPTLTRSESGQYTLHEEPSFG